MKKATETPESAGRPVGCDLQGMSRRKGNKIGILSVVPEGTRTLLHTHYLLVDTQSLQCHDDSAAGQQSTRLDDLKLI